MGIAFGPNGEPWVVGFGSQPLLAHLTQGTIEAQLLPVTMSPFGALTADSQGNLFFVAQNGHRRAELIERRAMGGGLHRTTIGMHAIFEPCCPNVAAKSIVDRTRRQSVVHHARLRTSHFGGRLSRNAGAEKFT